MTAVKTACLLLAILIMATPSPAWKMFSADEPDTGLLSNSFVDIVYADGTIWIATGSGLSYSTNQGFSWFTRTTETNPGLSSDEASALFSRPGQVWMAGSHFEPFEGVNYPFGDGISLSTDDGLTWETFSPPEASSFAKLAYDLAGNDSSTYAACFHGGMIVRHDPDTAWEHVFYSAADSLDWVADQWADLPSGRYYSCAVDTTHADTFVVYGGSARGINKLLYLPKRVRLGGKSFQDIEAVGDLIYLAHEGGITQTDTLLDKMYTADMTNGLGSNRVEKLISFNNRLYAATFDSAGQNGTGLYYLENPQTEWTVLRDNLTGPPDLWLKEDTNLFEGENAGVFDYDIFENVDGTILYIAAGDSGAMRSVDSGQTWQRFFVDPLDLSLSSPRNQVYSIDVTTDSMFLGTRAGLVIASYSEPLAFPYDTLVVFAESDTTGSMVSFVRHQDSDSASFIYVGLEPQTDTGSAGVLFLDPFIDPLDPDSNVQIRKTVHLYKTRLNDMYITEVFSLLAADSGLYFDPNLVEPALISRYNVVDNEGIFTLNSFAFNSVGYIDGKLFTGSSGGYAYGIKEEGEPLEWYVSLGKSDPKKRDLGIALTHQRTGLPGDWVVALDVQKYDTGAVLWAGCRSVPTDTLDSDSNAVGFSHDYGDTWNKVLVNKRVWNFGFDDSVAYAAASEGLYRAMPPWEDWERVEIVDPVTGDTIVEETEVFAVEVIEDNIWVGTELGLARRSVDPDSSWEITRVFKETEEDDEVFAAPVPYSPINNNGRLSIHYHVDRSAEVTVEIYDFAMNLVKTVAENRARSGGSDYFETWDGYNGRGDMVATGIYYIKVLYSTGDTKWGRLAIIP